jgi:ParB-like chromosome segregation protein Spo0J
MSDALVDVGDELGPPDGGAERPTISIVPHPSDLSDPVWVRIEDLNPGYSPRFEDDARHAEGLAAVEGPLPPIVIHRSTMRVIDGAHRLHAAMMRGRRSIEARFFEGSADDAFVEAVRTNVTHGKPLTTAEREAAAKRVLATHSHFSDRRIAQLCGLSGKTVASLRRGLSADLPPSNERLGLDGKVRPCDTSEGRGRAAAVIAERPDASLRDIAGVAGISPGTARDVRERVRRGASPYTVRQRSPERVTEAKKRSAAARSVETLLDDRSLTASDQGKDFVDWLESRVITVAEWESYVDSIPLSRVYVVADIVRSCASVWTELAERLEDRARRRG